MKENRYQEWQKFENGVYETIRGKSFEAIRENKHGVIIVDNSNLDGSCQLTQTRPISENEYQKFYEFLIIHENANLATIEKATGTRNGSYLWGIVRLKKKKTPSSKKWGKSNEN
jgi:hypothetical protein